MDIDPLRDDEIIKRRHRIRGVLLTMLGAFCFALAPVWVRSIKAYGSTSIVFYRALIGSIPLVIWVLRSPRLRQGADLRQMNVRQRWVLLGIGLSMCSTAACYYFAILKTTVAKAVLLHYTAPIYVAIVSPFLLKEKNSILTWIAVGTGILGTALIAEPTALHAAGRDEVLGIASALLSGLCLAGVFSSVGFYPAMCPRWCAPCGAASWLCCCLCPLEWQCPPVISGTTSVFF